jgi:hypothetical protein
MVLAFSRLSSSRKGCVYGNTAKDSTIEFQRSLLTLCQSLRDQPCDITLLYVAVGYVISADDARYLNHSLYPNLRTFADPDIDVSLRDIQIGEELLEDYSEFDEQERCLCL